MNLFLISTSLRIEKISAQYFNYSTQTSPEKENPVNYVACEAVTSDYEEHCYVVGV
jgi:hypothetical protein